MSDDTAVTDCLQQYARSTADPDEILARFYEAFAIGDSAASRDQGAQLILGGAKTATSDLLWSYERDGADPPAVGALSVVLDGTGGPVCVVETTTVDVVPFDDVDAAFAAAYGEWGDTLQSWREGAWAYYAAVSDQLGRQPSRDMPLVCERLRVVHRCISPLGE